MPRILLVEDNEMNRDMLSRRLQRKGYEVSIALDGRQGVEMARSSTSPTGFTAAPSMTARVTLRTVLVA